MREREGKSERYTVMEVVTNKEGGRRGSEGGSKGVREREGEREEKGDREGGRDRGMSSEGERWFRERCED